ncbi:MAG: glycosyltransferase family 2 protein [Chitinophagaceae bacterium]
MPQLSVVIITKNEACNIIDCIASAKKISTDIIIVDSGSTDATVSLAKTEQVRVKSIVWKGYGHARNTGALLACNDWIFALDADERITDAFARSIKNTACTDAHVIYGFKRINYFAGKRIRHGSFAHDRVARLYNRCNAQWNMWPVHEKLTGNLLQKVMLKTYLQHYTARTEAYYLQKIRYYAVLCALKYQQEGKSFIHARRWLSPAFNFVKDYIFQLGFLDKDAGFIIARLNAFYTRKKYQELLALLNEGKKHVQRPAFLQHSLRRIISFLS